VIASGRLAIPGFTRATANRWTSGARRIPDLRGPSWGEIVERVGQAARAARPGDWIFGQGWHQEKWVETPRPSVDGVPLHHALSAASPENPVSLAHASGHAIS
jgi:predicted amidohydrolase YtcJ